MNFENTLNKYKQKLIYHDLNRHIKPIRNSYQYFIVIPVLNELEYLFKTLNSINNQNSELLKKTLIVIVINNRADSSIHIKKNNRLTYEKIKKCNFEFEYVTLDYFSNGNELSVKKYGVGVARKIGMDYCLQFATGNSLLFSLDADTLISKSYLQLITKYYHSSNFNTCIVKFLHQKSSNPKIEKAIRLYEDILYDIAYKIKQCNSPYGYVSMGSTIICKVKAYIAVGGMPQKSAAEDFYFMQSLAKFSEINFLINKSIFNINKKDIYTKIYELDYLQNIKIYKNYPSTIIISGKETSLIAITYIDQKKYFVGNNEKFISTRKISNTKNLPTIFGKFKVSDFKSLKIKLIESELDISKIEKYYYHKNKRWDLYFTNNIILKLPSENISNAIKLYNKFKDLKKINSNTIIDLRIPNRLVIKNG